MRRDQWQRQTREALDHLDDIAPGTVACASMRLGELHDEPLLVAMDAMIPYHAARRLEKLADEIDGGNGKGEVDNV